MVAGDVPTLNQNTTGSAATLTTARTIAGTSFNGSANISLANKFIVQGTADAGLSGPQFLGALATGLVKNTTSTGVLSIAAASDVTGAALTGYVSGSGVVAATDTILQGIQKINGNDALKAPLASPTFTGTVTLPSSNLVNSASAATNAVIVYKNGHIKSTQTTAPTATVSANAGTGATCTLANATDDSGTLNLTTGTVSTASGTQCTINFNAAYATAPICVFSPANANSASLVATKQINFPDAATTTQTVNFGVAETVGTTYKWKYMCRETQ